MDKGKGKAKEKKLNESVFNCPFCKQTASVTCTVKAELRQAELKCEKCDESYWSTITYKEPIPQPIDVYKEWIAELRWILDYIKPDDDFFSTD